MGPRPHNLNPALPNRTVYDNDPKDQRSGKDGAIAINPMLVGHCNNVIYFN